MHLNRTAEWEHLKFSRASIFQFRAFRYIMFPNRNFVRKLYPLEFLESFFCSISSFSINYVPEPDIRVKSYDHSNFSRASVIQFLSSRYIMSPNRTSVRKFMTIWISRELLLFNFESLDILFPRIGHPCEKLWPLKFSKASVVQFRASWYIMSTNQTSEWNVMTIRISRELPLLNFERLNILCPRIGHTCEKLWPFKFLESFRCSISSALIYYFPELDICVKINDHSNFSRAFAVQFRASRWVMSANRTSLWKVMTIRISRVLSLCNFEHLDTLCPKFCCSISSVSIYYVLESDIRVKFMIIWISRELPLLNFERLDELCPRIWHLCEKL